MNEPTNSTDRYPFKYDLEPQHSPAAQSSLWANIRLTALRYQLRALGSIARFIAQADTANPRWLKARCAGEDLLIGEGVSWPSPLPGLSFAPLFNASAAHVSSGASVLEVGAGSGVWSLCCLRRGAQVSAADLPEVDLSGLVEAARRQGGTIETSRGDLFESIGQHRFDHVFFNPPFHIGASTTPEERAYFGGVNGDVVRRYLRELPNHLSAEGIGWIILPQRERALYQVELRALNVTEVHSQWLPVLGRVYLLALESPKASGPLLHTLPMNAVSECFLQLSYMMNTHSCEVVSLRGSIELEQLRSALREVMRRHVITRSLLSRRSSLSAPLSHRGLHWRTQHPTPPPVLIVEDLDERERAEIDQSIDDEGRWINELPRVILDRVWERPPLDPTAEVPVEWRLLNAESVSYLLLIAPHLCTDAFAGAQLIQEALEIYHQQLVHQREQRSDVKTRLSHLNIASVATQNATLESVSTPTPAPTLTPYLLPDPLQTRSSAQRERREGMRRLSKLRGLLAAFSGLLSDLVRPGGKVPSAHALRAERGQTELLIHRIAAPELKRVLSGARRRGVRAHSLFTWGLSRALKKWSALHGFTAPKYLRVVDLCVLRPLIDEERASDFDLLVQPYTRTMKSSWSDEHALNTIGRHLNRHKDQGIFVDLKRSALYAWISRWISLSALTRLTFGALLKTNITTTNPGPARFDLTEAGDAEVLEFINFPQIAPPAQLGLIYTTYQSELRILNLYDSSQWTEAQMKSLVDLLWAEVLTLAGPDER